MSNLVGTRGTFVFQFGNREDITVKFLFCTYSKKMRCYRVRLSIGRKRCNSLETWCDSRAELSWLEGEAAKLADEYAKG